MSESRPIGSRLVTGGCSCTQYCWPTWADYLGRHYTDFLNVGLCGADNAVIARNVIETARPGDVVVVAWSSFDRFSSFSDDSQQEMKTIGDQLVMRWSALHDIDHGGWLHRGGRCGSKEFLVNHYHRIERFRHSLDYIKMVEMHSQIVGYTLWNFSMIELFLGECERVVDPRLVEMFRRSNLRHFYLGKDLNTLRDETAALTLHHKYSSPDTHPTPLVHWAWVRDHMAKEIGIEIDLSLENRVQLDQQRVLIGDID